MQGNINFTGSLDGLISGGGDGSVVTITPTYDSGTKVADYTIDTVPGSIYVPASDSAVTDVKVNMENPANWISVVNGAGVAEVNFWTFMENVVAPFVWQRIQGFITMDDVNTKLAGYQKQMFAYGPGITISGVDHNEITLTFDIDDYLTIGDAVSTYQRALTAGRGISLDPYDDTIYTSFDINDYLTTEDAADTYQEKLVAGANITIDPDTNVISATGGGGGGGGINYSTTEQDTGITWTDGRHIYQKTILLPLVSNANVLNEIDLSQYLPADYDIAIKHETMYYHTATGYNYLLPYYIIGGAASYAIACGVMKDKLYIISGNSFPLNGDVTITLSYLKSV